MLFVTGSSWGDCPSRVLVIGTLGNLPQRTATILRALASLSARDNYYHFINHSTRQSPTSSRLFFE